MKNCNENLGGQVSGQIRTMVKNLDFNQYNEEELMWIIKNARESLNPPSNKNKYNSLYNIGDTVKVISRETYERDKGLLPPWHVFACGKHFKIKDVIICSLDNKIRYIFATDDIRIKGDYWKEHTIECKIE